MDTSAAPTEGSKSCIQQTEGSAIKRWSSKSKKSSKNIERYVQEAELGTFAVADTVASAAASASARRPRRTFGRPFRLPQRSHVHRQGHRTLPKARLVRLPARYRLSRHLGPAPRPKGGAAGKDMRAAMSAVSRPETGPPASDASRSAMACTSRAKARGSAGGVCLQKCGRSSVCLRELAILCDFCEVHVS